MQWKCASYDEILLIYPETELLVNSLKFIRYSSSEKVILAKSQQAHSQYMDRKSFVVKG